MSDTYPVQANNLKIGAYMMIKGKPCKIVSMPFSKPGKHGHGKFHFVGIDIFTGAKVDTIEGSSHNVQVPNVSRKEYTLIDLSDDGFLSLMDEGGEVRDDIKLPPKEDLAEEIQSKFDEGKELLINIQSAVGIEQVISWKLSAN